jgi:hypothetical protein
MAGPQAGIHRSGRTKRGRAGHGCARAQIIAFGSAPEDMIAFTSLLAHLDPSPRERIDPAALELLPYSSDTTGLAKV